MTGMMQKNFNSHYPFHIAAIDQKAVVNHPIYSQHSVLLLNKGTIINEEHAKKLVSQKLQRPIEHNILLEEPITSEELFRQLSNLIEKHADFSEIEAHHQALPLIKNFCFHFIGYALLQQKLTVMASSLPTLYLKSLFTAWFSVCIGQLQDYSPEQLQLLFYAGILHDIGMLEFPYRFSKKNAQFDSNQRQQLESHPSLAYSFLRQVPNLPYKVSKSVLEHHERIDGTGFPNGLEKDKLSLSGQIIALCDAFYTMRFSSQYKQPLSSLSQVLPILQVSGDQFLQEICNHVITLVTHSCQEKLRYQQLDQHFYHRILKQIAELKDKFNKRKALLQRLKNSNAYTLKYQTIIISTEHFIKTTQRAGIEFGSLSAWIKYLKESKDTISQDEQLVVENLEILLQELEHLDQRLHHKLKILPKVKTHCAHQTQFNVIGAAKISAMN